MKVRLKQYTCSIQHTKWLGLKWAAVMFRGVGGGRAVGVGEIQSAGKCVLLSVLRSFPLVLSISWLAVCQLRCCQQRRDFVSSLCVVHARLGNVSVVFHQLQFSNTFFGVLSRHSCTTNTKHNINVERSQDPRSGNHRLVRISTMEICILNNTVLSPLPPSSENPTNATENESLVM